MTDAITQAPTYSPRQCCRRCKRRISETLGKKCWKWREVYLCQMCMVWKREQLLKLDAG